MENSVPGTAFKTLGECIINGKVPLSLLLSKGKHFMWPPSRIKIVPILRQFVFKVSYGAVHTEKYFSK